MYRTLLVDDELLVRMNLKLLLQNCPNLTICGEAEDGIDALKMADELQPNLIFTDIRMPQMDGIEFCKKIHMAYPDTIIIALSNYDDYPYVRGALKNGATDYILKHKLSTESLTELLHEIENKRSLSCDSPQPESDTVLQKRTLFLKNIIGGSFTGTEEEILEQLKLLSVPLNGTNVLVVLFVVDNYDNLVQHFSKSDGSPMDFAIMNIATEILNRNKNGVIINLENGEFCVLLSFHTRPNQSELNVSVHSIIEQISENLRKFLNISCCFGIGDLSSSLESVGESFRAAQNNVRLNRFYVNPTLIQSRSTSSKENNLTGLDYTLETQLLTLVNKGSWEEILPIIKQIFNEIFKNRTSRSNVQMICTDMLGILTRAAKKNDISLELVFTDSVSPNKILAQLNTLGKLQDWFLDAFKNICFYIRSSLPGSSDYIKKAIKCINRDFSKPISEQSVADEIGISISYFSTSFKSETGQGFSEYLTSIRIQTALELLDSGEKNLHKISQACGFQDYSYFSKVFKKKVGMPPKNYRDYKKT